ncbi:MAG: transporter [Sphingomonas bacterium]|uniref:ABC transporter ATP-binding protein n=1 Tax=Sphingomonas bacterium TaxID=1895847 RepID=UPI002627745F|nr:ABC transporter ATP-binding protein [Sphingomonas bacterium]MDB5704565.1 transporter [Sphingomonas bacterium]
MELIIEGVSVTLSGRNVLDDIGAVLRPGRVTAILGPNGAGKSTLIKTAAALIAPTLGVVRLGDRSVAALDPRERARTIGYLPQDASVHWNIAASEVVALGRAPHRAPFAAPDAHDAEAVAKAMAATETTHLADRPVNQLSGGERARVLLARVLAGEPDWLLADEPLAGLDPRHQLDILDRLAEVAKQGRGVGIVLHDLLHAGRIADDVLLLKDGRVLASGAAEAVLTRENLREAFEIEVSVGRDAQDRLVCLPLGRT